MRTNGFKIREALRSWTVARDVAAKQFNESIFAFEGEEKVAPLDVARQFQVADKNVALFK